MGSSPTASADNEWAHRPTGRHRSCKPALSKFDTAGATPDGSTFLNKYSQHHGPVVQRRRLLAYTQATMVRVHPGSIRRRSSGPDTPMDERLGLNPIACRFDSCSGHMGKARLGRQLADHPRLERRMLRVQIPPEPLDERMRLWRSGVLVSLSRRRSRVRIPSDALKEKGYRLET